ncbi:MAG: hypothetical protein AAB091_04815, partial [Elusimicrobiota bacterium]
MKSSNHNSFRILPLLPLLAYLGACASGGSRLKVGAVEGGEVIESEGSCPVQNGDTRGAKECSLRDAQKKALERVIGVYVSAKTRVEKAITIEQNILANTEGLISKYDIVKEGRQEEFYNTKIRALVLFQKIGEQLKALNVLREPSIGLPRVAVIVSDAVGAGRGPTGGDDAATHTYCANAMGEALIQAGYKIVDPEAIMTAKAYETIDKAENDPEAMKGLGTKLNAEIIIFGEAKVSPIQMDSNILGGMKSYRATVSAKAARVQTGGVLQNVSAQASGLDAVDDAAIQKALETVGKKAGDNLAGELHKRLIQEASISLTISNVADFQKLDSLKSTLTAMSGVRDIFLRS